MMIAEFQDDKTILLTPESNIEYCLLEKFGDSIVKVKPPLFSKTLEVEIKATNDGSEK